MMTLDRVRKLAEENRALAIHASLEDIYRIAHRLHPRVIVELGVSREALANKVLAWVAEENQAHLYSCDLYDFSTASKYERWHFHQGNAIEYAVTFGGGLVDLIFIDTDELYQTTKAIVDAWVPKLSPEATLMFRCSNLQKELRYRDRPSTRMGWDNERGVIRVIHELIGWQFDEGSECAAQVNGWAVKHWPWGGGLTAIRQGPAFQATG